MNQQVVTFHKEKTSTIKVAISETTELPDVEKKQDNETILTIDQAKHVVFSELKVLNAVLTNACNLSCSYCFEQHKKDYGRFNLETLKKAYDFLVNANTLENKRFQFFGGEPMAQKKLILEFIRTYDEELTKNKSTTQVSIVTNGLLLTPEFIEEYCNKPYANMCISLDTHDAEVDKRDIDQAGIDYIMEMIRLIPQRLKDTELLAIRITINQESVYQFEEFCDKLYALGVRHLLIHPLIMSREQGMVVWNEEVWKYHYDSVVRVITKYHDLRIEWAEGVGIKGESNCMVGSDMITMDASGDFSGCYFFTNLKSDVPHTLLGNLFKDEIFIDRYKGFQKQYSNFQDNHEECQTCNYRNFCYQCPAGNVSLGGDLFRPDGMCKRIVSLFVTLRQDINKKMMNLKIKRIREAYEEEGKDVLSRTAIHLMSRYFTGAIADDLKLREMSNLPDYRNVLAEFRIRASNNCEYEFDLSSLLSDLNMYNDKLSAVDFYKFICEKFNIPVPNYETKGTVEEECYFLGLTHLPLFNGSQYTGKEDPEHTRSRIFEL